MGGMKVSNMDFIKLLFLAIELYKMAYIIFFYPLLEMFCCRFL